MKPPTRFALVVLTICVSLVPVMAVAAESNIELARKHAETGDEHFRAGRFEAARAEFLEAFGLLPWPTIGLDAARSQEKTQHLVEAAELYRRTIQLQPDDSWPKKPENRRLQVQAQTTAAAELAALLPRIAALTVTIKGAWSESLASSLTLSIDGIALPSDAMNSPQAMNPGRHTVGLSIKDGTPLTEEVSLVEAERKTIAFDGARLLPPPATDASADASAPSPLVVEQPRHQAMATSPQGNDKSIDWSTVGWSGIIVGAAGVVVGTTAGIVSLVKKSDLEESGCNGNYQCTETAMSSSRMQSYDTWRKVSTVGFIAGGAFAAAGVTLLLVSAPRSSAPKVSLAMGASHLAIRGTF